jgi:hypothetical protein
LVLLDLGAEEAGEEILSYPQAQHKLSTPSAGGNTEERALVTANPSQTIRPAALVGSSNGLDVPGAIP